MSLPAVVKHLNVLERADLIRRQRQGRTVLVSVRPEALDAALRYLQIQRKFWEQALDRLERYIEREDETHGR